MDERSGVVITGGSYSYNSGTNLKADLEARTGAHVSIENDGNCAALAELAGGSLEGVRVLVGYCRRFAHLIYSLQTVLDVEAFAIGGGISAAPAFGRTLASELSRIYESTYAQRLGLVAPKLVTCHYRNEANLIGALYHHFNGTGKE